MLVTMVVIPYVKKKNVYFMAVTVSFHCKGMMTRITIMVLMTLIQYINIYIYGNNGSPASYGGNDAGNDAGMR